MDAAQLSTLVDEFNYILAKISKYLKKNQYVYLRAFDSWKDGYNAAAERLNTDKTLSVPLFTLSPADYSPSGKSIQIASVNKFVKTINHQILRLEERIDELHRAAARHLAAPHPLAAFFPQDSEGMPLNPAPADKRVVVAVPATEGGQSLLQRGIRPVLRAQGLSCFGADRPPVDDEELCGLCRELYACRLAICDLAGQASHVMLVLGLACGIGKPVIVLNGPAEMALGALSNAGYLNYADVAALKALLGARLRALLEG